MTTHVRLFLVTLDSPVNANIIFSAAGVFVDSTCAQAKINHAVLAVGYGSQPTDYWLVKNSWSAQWGEQGYIRMARNRNNMCYIASMATFPE